MTVGLDVAVGVGRAGCCAGAIGLGVAVRVGSAGSSTGVGPAEGRAFRGGWVGESCPVLAADSGRVRPIASESGRGFIVVRGSGLVGDLVSAGGFGPARTSDSGRGFERVVGSGLDGAPDRAGRGAGDGRGFVSASESDGDFRDPGPVDDCALGGPGSASASESDRGLGFLDSPAPGLSRIGRRNASTGDSARGLGRGSGGAIGTGCRPVLSVAEIRRTGGTGVVFGAQVRSARPGTAQLTTVPMIGVGAKASMACLYDGIVVALDRAISNTPSPSLAITLASMDGSTGGVSMMILRYR